MKKKNLQKLLAVLLAASLALSCLSYSEVRNIKAGDLSELTGTPIPTAIPEPTAMPIPTETPEPTAMPIPTETPEPTATPIPTETSEPTATPIPTETPEPTATPIPTETSEPTATPIPTAIPEPTATPQSTKVPNQEPSVEGWEWMGNANGYPFMFLPDGWIYSLTWGPEVIGSWMRPLYDSRPVMVQCENFACVYPEHWTEKGHWIYISEAPKKFYNGVDGYYDFYEAYGYYPFVPDEQKHLIAGIIPEPTEMPEPTVTPIPTVTPEPAVTPIPTETPEPTEMPTPTAIPQPTVTPVPTATPVPEADKSRLEKLLKSAEAQMQEHRSIESEQWTDSSYEILQSTYQTAQEVYMNKDVKQEMVDVSAAALQVALDGKKLKRTESAKAFYIVLVRLNSLVNQEKLRRRLGAETALTDQALSRLDSICQEAAVFYKSRCNTPGNYASAGEIDSYRNQLLQVEAGLEWKKDEDKESFEKEKEEIENNNTSENNTSGKNKNNSFIENLEYYTGLKGVVLENLLNWLASGGNSLAKTYETLKKALDIIELGGRFREVDKEQQTKNPSEVNSQIYPLIRKLVEMIPGSTEFTKDGSEDIARAIENLAEVGGIKQANKAADTILEEGEYVDPRVEIKKSTPESNRKYMEN